MQQLLQKLQTIKQEKLAAFKKELAEQEAQELLALTTQVRELKADIDRVTRTTLAQKESKTAFETEITTQFALDSYKQELLSLFWQDITKQHFSKTEVQQNWVIEQLDRVLSELPEEGKEASGTVQAGVSYDALKKAKLPKGFKLTKSESTSELAEQPGFVLRTETVQVDARLSTVLQELFSQHQSDLYKVAFK